MAQTSIATITIVLYNSSEIRTFVNSNIIVNCNQGAIHKGGQREREVSTQSVVRNNLVMGANEI